MTQDERKPWVAMTDDELRERWVGALVKRDVADDVGEVLSVTPHGGRLVLAVAWAGGGESRVNASAVSLLCTADIEAAFRQWRLGREECARLRRIIAAVIEAAKEYGR